jgi:predicted RNA-binding Zn ribbon-like protein
MHMPKGGLESAAGGRLSFFLDGGRLSLDFANTVQVSGAPEDGLHSWRDLVEFLEVTGAVETAKRGALLELERTAPEETATVSGMAVALRDALREICAARVARQPLRADWIAPINAVLRHTEGHDWLEHGDGSKGGDWRLTIRARSQGLAWLLAAIARSAGKLIDEGQEAPIRKCANPKCALFFYDDSRTGKRRWCSMATCGNRAKVAAHFRRLRARNK